MLRILQIPSNNSFAHLNATLSQLPLVSQQRTPTLLVGQNFFLIYETQKVIFLPPPPPQPPQSTLSHFASLLVPMTLDADG